MKKLLQFILGFILSGGVFIVSIYITDFLNNRLAIYLGIGIISVLGFLVLRKKIRPLTTGFLIGLIPVAIAIIGFTIISKLH